MNKPVIGVIIGDPSGIGPEIALKACINKSVVEGSIPVLFGPREVIEEAVTRFCVSYGENRKI